MVMRDEEKKIKNMNAIQIKAIKKNNQTYWLRLFVNSEDTRQKLKIKKKEKNKVS